MLLTPNCKKNFIKLFLPRPPFSFFFFHWAFQKNSSHTTTTAQQLNRKTFFHFHFQTKLFHFRSKPVAANKSLKGGNWKSWLTFRLKKQSFEANEVLVTIISWQVMPSPYDVIPFTTKLPNLLKMDSCQTIGPARMAKYFQSHLLCVVDLLFYWLGGSAISDDTFHVSKATESKHDKQEVSH